MWLWNHDLKRLGFKKKSKRYFQCTRGYGLEPNQHISLFLWTASRRSKQVALYEVSEFHITSQIGRHHLHFYYHEVTENVWASGGSTSFREIEALGCCPLMLGHEAHRITIEFVEALGGQLLF